MPIHIQLAYDLLPINTYICVCMIYHIYLNAFSSLNTSLPMCIWAYKTYNLLYIEQCTSMHTSGTKENN